MSHLDSHSDSHSGSHSGSQTSHQAIAAPQVELTLQDYFFEPEGVTGAAPIDLETWQHWFEAWMAQLRSHLPAQSYELSLRLTHDAEIQQLNAQYRQKNQPTDVLAFAALEVNFPQPNLAIDQPVYLGDMIISVETAQRQSAQRHPLDQELAWLASHALLHLLGWDHPDEVSFAEMMSQQEALLQTVGISFVYDRAEPAAEADLG